MALSAPEPIGTSHQVGDFTSGVFSLDEWLKRRAVANQASGAARTFVVCEADKVIGYYALASGSVTVAAAPGRFRRNMPEPIPVVVLARLAVDRAYHGRSLGPHWTTQGASYMRPMQSVSVPVSCTQSRMTPRHFTSRSDLSRRRLNR